MLAARLIEATSPSASSPATSAPAVTTRPGATPLCPANNGFIYTTENGQEFVIECFMYADLACPSHSRNSDLLSSDHPGGNLDMIEMTGAGNTWFAQCIETCASYPGCLDVSLSGAVRNALWSEHCKVHGRWQDANPALSGLLFEEHSQPAHLCRRHSRSPITELWHCVRGIFYDSFRPAHGLPSARSFRRYF